MNTSTRLRQLADRMGLDGFAEELREIAGELEAPSELFGYFRAEPMGWTDCAATDEGAIALYEHPAAPAVPQDMRLVPVWLLERVEQSLGSFTSDEGWSQSDMDTMDSVSAMLAAIPAPAPAQEVGLTDDEIDENTVWHDPDPHDNVHCDVSATVRKCLAALRAKGGK